MSKHHCYVEPFGGSAAVLFEKPLSAVEIFNDIHSDLINFMLQLRDNTQALYWKAMFTPYSRAYYQHCQRVWRDGGPKDKLERAVVWLYLQAASVSGYFSRGWSHSDQDNKADNFHNRADKMLWFGHRLRHVTIECRDYKEVIQTYDSPETLQYCLPPGQLVRMADENLKPIESLTSGDLVYPDGRISRVFRRPYRGTVLSIKVSGIYSPLRLTPEHPVLAVSGAEVSCKYLGKANRKCTFALHSKVNYCKPSHRGKCSGKTYSPRFLPAQELQIGDLMAVPIGGRGCLLEDFYIKSPPPKKQGRLKPYIEVVSWKKLSQLLRLLGFYLAEGHIGKDKQGRARTVGWSFGPSEDGFVQEVVSLAQELFGLRASISRLPWGVYQVRINSSGVAQWFQKMGGELAKQKCLDSSLMLLPPFIQLELVKYWFKGDGGLHCAANNKAKLTGTTISPTLAEQMYLLLLRCGLMPSMKRRAGKVWDVYLSNNGDIGALTGKEVHGKARTLRLRYKDWILTPIKRITSEDYSGPVYNLTVTPYHSFVANFVLSKNCDPPYILGSESLARTYYGSVFTMEDHRVLASLLNTVKGKVILSYYPHPLLAEFYSDWERVEIDVSKSSSGVVGDEEKPRATELLLLNYKPVRQLVLPVVW